MTLGEVLCLVLSSAYIPFKVNNVELTYGYAACTFRIEYGCDLIYDLSQCQLSITIDNSSQMSLVIIIMVPQSATSLSIVGRIVFHQVFIIIHIHKLKDAKCHHNSRNWISQLSGSHYHAHDISNHFAMISLAIIHNDTPYMNTTNRDQNISMSSCYGGTTYHIVNILL